MFNNGRFDVTTLMVTPDGWLHLSYNHLIEKYQMVDKYNYRPQLSHKPNGNVAGSIPEREIEKISTIHEVPRTWVDTS